MTKEKINVAELIKDCPSGMELDCTNYSGVVTFKQIVDNPNYPIIIKVKCGDEYFTHALTKYGQTAESPYNKCIIFPKGKTTWEGFQRPFKEGDILYVDCTDESDDKQHEYIFIFDRIYNDEVHSYCYYYIHNGFCFRTASLTDTKYPIRFATEEEKKKLFDVIKENGYKWNAETKTLEKLIELKFKVGDRIKHKTHIKQENVVTKIKDTYYILDNKSVLSFIFQDEYELVLNKFDITTFKPFESKVLVRTKHFHDKWIAGFFSHKDSDGFAPFWTTADKNYQQCIPYENNEHLLGKTDDCDEFFKTWK